MGKFEVTCTARIPERASLELEIVEKVVSYEDEVQNSITQPLQDGTHKYIIEDVDGSLDADISTKVHFERDNPEVKSPSVSSMRISRPGKTKLAQSDVSAKDMFAQAESFCKKVIRSSPPESRYYLNSFLNSVYSIEELFRERNLGFNEWISEYSDTEAEQQLHDYMMEQRTYGTHLGASADSAIRPQVGRSLKIEFGVDKGASTSSETQTEEGTKKEQYVFVKIPHEIINKIESADNFPEIESINSVVGDERAQQRSLPVDILCEAYLSLVARWLKEVGPAFGIIDSIDRVDTVVWGEKS